MKNISQDINLNIFVVGTWVAKRPLGRPRLSHDETNPRGRKNPCELICELGQLFYNLGWVSGTGGGISIKDG